MSSRPLSKQRLVLEIRGLRTEFPSAEGAVIAVNDVSLSVDPGEIVGIVGESGSGKSVIGLFHPGIDRCSGRIAAGSVSFAVRNWPAGGGGAARRSRQSHRHYLPGSDDVAASLAAHRAPDD